MVAERVPRELAGEAVILVEVVPRVREDEIGIDVLQPLEDVLDLPADVRAGSRRGTRGRERRPTPRRRGTPPRSPAPRRSRSPLAASTTQVTSSSGTSSREREQRPPAADLDVVRMTADREDAPNGRVAPPSARLEHQPRSAPRGARARDASPLEHDRVEILLVLDRVHRRPEAVVAVHDQLASLRQPERLRP